MRGVQQVFRNTKVDLGKEVFRHEIIFYQWSRRTDKGLQNHSLLRWGNQKPDLFSEKDSKEKSEGGSRLH